MATARLRELHDKTLEAADVMAFLDVLKKLQSNTKIDLQMHEANLPELREVLKVDERLVILAKALSARLSRRCRGTSLRASTPPGA